MRENVPGALRDTFFFPLDGGFLLKWTVMKKHIHWLLNELETWVREGIISDDQAMAIRGRYPTPEQAGTWGRIAFAAAGAILIGLGVILLFAYNWEKMHKFLKLSVVFTALIAAHGAAFATGRTAAKETLHLLGTMFFGAGIWLVAQVYHIEEHYPNAFIVWGAGALALAWALPSLAQSLIAAFLFALWDGFEVFAFSDPNRLAPVLIFLGILPLAWLLRSRVLASAGLASFLFTLFATAQRQSWQLVIPVFLSCAAALLAAGIIMQKSRRAPELASVCVFFGNGLYLFLIFILTFPGTRAHMTLLFRELPATLWILVPSAAALCLWVWAFWPFSDLRERIAAGLRIEHLAAPIALALYLVQTNLKHPLGGFLGAAPYNLLFLFSAVMLMQRGFRTLHLRSAVMGSVLLAALAIARYADLFQSLLARAAVFLLVGGMMLGVGVFFARARRTRQGGPS